MMGEYHCRERTGKKRLFRKRGREVRVSRLAAFLHDISHRKLEKKLLKSQTGHMTDSMLAHYGEHQTENNRKTIQAMAVWTSGGLIPSGAIYIEKTAECG
jgi:hypothetical protein